MLQVVRQVSINQRALEYLVRVAALLSKVLMALSAVADAIHKL